MRASAVTPERVHQSEVSTRPNPTSAIMCSMQINWIDDCRGVPLNKFRRLCQTHEDNLPALMVAKQL